MKLPSDKYYAPTNKVFYVVFDESNGDELTKRYLWWFDSKRAAADWLRGHRLLPNGSKVSKPYAVRFATPEEAQKKAYEQKKVYDAELDQRLDHHWEQDFYGE